jgi:hypothetical protein
MLSTLFIMLSLCGPFKMPFTTNSKHICNVGGLDLRMTHNASSSQPNFLLVDAPRIAIYNLHALHSTSLLIPHKHIVNHQVECQIGKGDLTLHMGIISNG